LRTVLKKKTGKRKKIGREADDHASPGKGPLDSEGQIRAEEAKLGRTSSPRKPGYKGSAGRKTGGRQYEAKAG